MMNETKSVQSNNPRKSVIQTNIPKLRFPEFKGEWERKKLGEVAEKINSGKTPLGGESVYTERGILFIRSQNVNDDKLSFENSTYIPEEINNTMKNSVVKANDILLNITGASLGRSCVVPNDFIIGNVNQHVCIIRLNKEESNPRFVQPILSSTKGQNIFISLQTGSGREGLNFESIKGIEISFPTLPEQTRIAAFFTVIDKKISELKQKKALLEQYKKGVMQKLFPSASSGQAPELRFKDDTSTSLSGGNGKDFPDWEKKKLGEVLDYEQPTNYLVSSTEYEDRFETPVVTAGKTFILGYTDETNGIFKDNLPVIIFDDFTTATQFVNFPFKAKSSAMKILKAKENSNIKFIYEAMQMIDYETGGHGRHWISVFAEMEISIPSLPEQTKIANFLSDIDEKINVQTQFIASLEQWKKGLLQQMFV
jgi:type I restriction enzyme S subunit